MAYFRDKKAKKNAKNSAYAKYRKKVIGNPK